MEMPVVKGILTSLEQFQNWQLNWII